MRTVTFGLACSIDMFIARLDGAVDWLFWSDDVAAIASEFWASIDTVVMGRKTYEVALASGAAAYPGVKNYVCSRSMRQDCDPAVTLIQDAVEFVRRLKRESGQGICVMGGGELAHSLFAADVIDEIGLNIHPVLLGSGIPLFPYPTTQIDLQLTAARPLAGGCVLVRYRVKR